MTHRTPAQSEDLELILTNLPAEKMREVFDFAAYLHQRYAPNPPRGSVNAILQALEDTGPLQFEEGELDSLLDDLAAMRELDMNGHG